MGNNSKKPSLSYKSIITSYIFSVECPVLAMPQNTPYFFTLAKCFDKNRAFLLRSLPLSRPTDLQFGKKKSFGFGSMKFRSVKLLRKNFLSFEEIGFDRRLTSLTTTSTSTTTSPTTLTTTTTSTTPTTSTLQFQQLERF